MSAETLYNEWLNDPYFDEETKKELLSIKDDKNEIEERFYRELEFGTAGLRGVIGAGLNRMNKYTVRKATQGLADYIIAQGAQEKGVAISYDSRHFSPEFADETALCLAANGIKAYVFTSLRPTPVLSFALRYLKCTAGVNITASHNPSEFNGYKVYWEDGAQITPPHDTGIMAAVRAITDFSSVKTMEKDEALRKGLYIPIDKEVDDAYDKELLALVKEKEAVEKYAGSIKVVYTPLHGTGMVPVARVLGELGFTQFYPVKEQAEPDGDFPTVSYPNPEADEAFELGLKLAKEIDADLILATDPDADRLGVRVRGENPGEYHDLNGNMSGCLLANYEISRRKAAGDLPDDGMLISTIVSTNMAKAIAEHYGTGYKDVLTGFKYIGEQILSYENSGHGTFLFGFEESYGCLFGTYARDKDAVAASMALCEAAAYYKSVGKNLWDVMQELYLTLGYYKESVKSVTMPGISGMEKIASTMEGLRSDPPKNIGGLDVLKIRDYKNDTITDMANGEAEPTGLPSSNVLYYELENDAWVAVRPSGTEPKIKFYYGIKGENETDAAGKSEEMLKAIEALAE